MIIDACAHLGAFTRRLSGLEPGPLLRLLAPWEIREVHVGRLEALWLENPHEANRLPFLSSDPEPGSLRLIPAPVLDASLASWPEELARLQKSGLVKPGSLVRLYPSYHGYKLDQADAVFEALGQKKLVAQVMVRIEDSRRQHRLAQVPDVPVATIHDAAKRHPRTRILISGANSAELTNLAPMLSTTPNLWADTSQADGVLTVYTLSTTPWRDRLVFGSHAPLFTPQAAFARVLDDLDDPTANQILSKNPAGLRNF